MTRSSRARIALAMLGLAFGPVGCGGSARVETMRVPAKHRAAGTSCAQQRAAVHPTPVDPNLYPPDSNPCAQDSDCMDGQNGRCVQPAPGPRRLTCSYDECFADAQCTSNAPCECRASASDGSPNSCLQSGNCRVDADCGEGGYCSPSLLNQFCICPSPTLCGQGYFCHSPKDTCLDDSDCADGSCNYDSVEKRWACARCTPIP
jgi:hypothetical protein